MSTQFLSKLSQNYIELLEDDEYHDITIEVGEDPNVKFFRGHMNILCYRSPYFRRTLSIKKNKGNDLAHNKLQNVSPEVFQIILKYIYGGILSLNEQDTSEVLKILVAADKLLLQELIDYLQKYLIEDKSIWLEQHFELIHQTSSQSNNLLELQQYCTNLMASSPGKIFKSFDFTSLPEKSLIQLIKRDDLQMREVEIWKHVLKWGLAQNPTLLPDLNTWSYDDFKAMENTLQHCFPLIRFFSLSSTEFSRNVRPYEKLLKCKLYEDLLDSYLDTDSEPTDNISLPRVIKFDGIIDSKIVNSLSVVLTISRWIDKVDIIHVNNKFAQFRELYLPYKFELLLKGSQDGFTPKKFHELCDDKPHTVTFIKVKGTKEILGGHNPIIWNSSGWGKTKDSFIFSFKNNENNFKDAILSKVENADYAINYFYRYGPCFGIDMCISNDSNGSCDYNSNYCKKKYYDKMVRGTEDKFSIEDYEVFQIVKR